MLQVMTCSPAGEDLRKDDSVLGNRVPEAGARDSQFAKHAHRQRPCSSRIHGDGFLAGHQQADAANKALPTKSVGDGADDQLGGRHEIGVKRKKEAVSQRGAYWNGTLVVFQRN